MEADQDQDGKISFDEFKKMVENTDVSMSMTLGMLSFLFAQFRALLTISFYRSILVVLTAIPAGSVARRCILNSCWAQFIMAWNLRQKERENTKNRKTSASARRASHKLTPGSLARGKQGSLQSLRFS
jgi:hypothetical protein